MLRIRTNHEVRHPVLLPRFRGDGTETKKTLPRLLIVDDDPQVLRVAERLLRSDWRIETANNAADAVMMLQTRRYDAVLSDFEMPGQNGLWLLKAARQFQPAARRVLFSGSSPSDLSDHLRSGLLHCFVSKPPQRHELADSLRWDAPKV